MDGKKRIARLRNAEKWKKLGFGNFFGIHKVEPSPKKPKKKKKVAVEVAGFFRPFKEKKAPEGKVWDEWNCCWVDTPSPGVFGTPLRVIEALVKKGYKKLGSGHYSTVMAKDGSDKVIKITRHQDNWIDYVRWAAQKGYAGGFAPRVYSWKKFPAGWSWAVMERMDRCLGPSGHYNSSGDCEMSNGESDLDLIFSLISHSERGNVLAQVYMEDLAPGAFAFVKDLRKTMRASDIRGANTMIRKDGSLCFTDPCAGESTITSKRLRSGDFSPSIWRYFIEGCYRH